MMCKRRSGIRFVSKVNKQGDNYSLRIPKNLNHYFEELRGMDLRITVENLNSPFVGEFEDE